jgi:hypothetical protein
MEARMPDDPVVVVQAQEVPIKLKRCRTPMRVVVPFKLVPDDLANWGSELKGAVDLFLSKLPDEIRTLIEKFLFAFTGVTPKDIAYAVIDGLIAAAKHLKPKHLATFTAVKCCPASDCEISGELEPDTPITFSGVELKPSWTTHDPGTDTVPCKCSSGADGTQKEQVFTCTWIMTISIPSWGITYSSPVHVVDFHVFSPCCCSDTEKEDPTPPADGTGHRTDSQETDKKKRAK